MAVDPAVQDFIARSMAENNRSLMSEISTLITNSVESIKRSNSEAVEDQLREIKKIRREEPKSFKRKGNEVQYKFNAKIQDSIDEAKSYLESNAVDKAKESLTEGTSLVTERQKLILLADKSEFGWKTVQEYTQHELAEDDQDGKKIRRAEERAEKSLKSVAAKKSKKKSKVDSLVLLVVHNLPVFHFNEVHPLHRGAIGSRSIHARSRIFLQNLGAVSPAGNLVIGGLNVRWFVLLLLLNLGGIHDCAQMTKVSHIFLCFAPRLTDKKNWRYLLIFAKI